MDRACKRLIELEKISKSYSSLRVLEEVSLYLSEGETVSILKRDKMEGKEKKILLLLTFLKYGDIVGRKRFQKLMYLAKHKVSYPIVLF